MNEVAAKSALVAAPCAARWSRTGVLAVLGTGILAGAMLGSIASGPIHLSWADVLHALRGEGDPVARQIVWNLRLPRVLVGALVGLDLAVAGILLQAVVQNPLASPGIVGVTAGAGLAATAVLVIAPGWPSYLPLAAFVGGLVTAVVVYAISWLPGTGTSPLRMVLGGVAVTSVLGAITTFLMIAWSDRVGSVVLWLSGSLNARSWEHLHMLWPYSLVGLLLALSQVRSLDILQLGDDVASGLGLRVERVRLLAVLAATILAGAAVSVSGMIGFVGLVVPHITRLLVGPRNATAMVFAGLGGAILLVASDWLARIVVSPTELPVGVVIALIGGPYFVFLLYRTKLL